MLVYYFSPYLICSYTYQNIANFVNLDLCDRGESGRIIQVNEIVKQHPSLSPRRVLAQFNFAFVSLQSHCHKLASTFDLLQLGF